LFVALCVWCISYATPRIQLDLESRSAIALLAADLPLDEIVFRGRDATITRSLASPGRVDEVMGVLRQVRGIRTITVAQTSSASEVP
jgi:hypothetical protein